MRIVHISNVWPPYFGGQGKVVLEEVKALYELGEEVSVITFDFGQDKNDYPWPVYYLKPKLHFGLSGLFYSGLKDKLKGADIIQLHLPSFGLDLGLLWYAFRHRRKKIVIYYHMDPVGNGLVGLIFVLWRSLILPMLVSRARLVIGSTADYLEHSIVWKYLKECRCQSEVVPFGVSQEFFLAQSKSSARPYFLCVGSLDVQHKNKNLLWLLKTWAEAGLEKKAELWIVGGGVLEDYYKKYAQSLGLTSIVFKGRVSAEILPSFYAGASATILPAKSRTEAFGLVQLESLATGTPVIVQDIWGVREVAKNFGHSSGFIIPVDDSASLISLLYFILETRPRFQADFEQLKKNWSWQAHAHKLLEIYRAL